MDLHFCLCHRARQIWVINQIYSQAMLQYPYCECDACVIFLICTEELQLWHYLKPRQYFITEEKWDFIPSSEFTFFIFLLGTNSHFPSLFFHKKYSFIVPFWPGLAIVNSVSGVILLCPNWISEDFKWDNSHNNICAVKQGFIIMYILLLHQLHKCTFHRL